MGIFALAGCASQVEREVDHAVQARFTFHVDSLAQFDGGLAYSASWVSLLEPGRRDEVVLELLRRIESASLASQPRESLHDFLDYMVFTSSQSGTLVPTTTEHLAYQAPITASLGRTKNPYSRARLLKTLALVQRLNSDRVKHGRFASP